MTALLEQKKPLWAFSIIALIGIGGILYGYDIGVVSGALLFIGETIPMSDTQIGIVVSAVLAGGLIGTLLAGPLSDRFGRRLGIATASIIFIAGVLFVLWAHSFITLLIARLLLGIGVGVVAVAVPLYVTECVPKEDRGKYVGFFQLFLTLGVMLAYLIDLLLSPVGSWHAMFAVVLIPAILLLIGAMRLPESPRWLVAHDQIDQARRVLRHTRTQARAEAALIAIYESLKQSPASWRGLLSPRLMLPLFLGIAVAILNQWTGINVFLQYAADILKSAGLGSDFASTLGSIGIGISSFITTIVALLLIDRIGRKPLLIIGICGVLLAEIFLGAVNYVDITAYMQGILSLIGLLVFIVFFAIGPGVVVWLVITELLPTRVRGKGMAICLFFSSLSGAAISAVFLDLRDWLGMAGAYWLCAAFTLLYLFVTIFILPETKAKSLEQIQYYFTQPGKLTRLDISNNKKIS